MTPLSREQLVRVLATYMVGGPFVGSAAFWLHGGLTSDTANVAAAPALLLASVIFSPVAFWYGFLPAAVTGVLMMGLAPFPKSGLLYIAASVAVSSLVSFGYTQAFEHEPFIEARIPISGVAGGLVCGLVADRIRRTRPERPSLTL